MSVRLLLWDLGGVLCRFRPARRTQTIAARSGRAAHEVDAALDDDVRDRLDRGELSLEQLVAHLRAELGWPCEPLELGRAWIAAFEPDSAVLSLARRVLVPASVLTNNGAPVSDLYPVLLPAVAAVVPTALFSGATRRTKPSPDAFRHACRALHAPPAQTLLVDDSRANVDGAAEAGLRVHRYRSADELERVLDDLGLLPGAGRTPSSPGGAPAT